MFAAVAAVSSPVLALVEDMMMLLLSLQTWDVLAEAKDTEFRPTAGQLRKTKNDTMK
jgi:hypothetical protein